MIEDVDDAHPELQKMTLPEQRLACRRLLQQAEAHVEDLKKQRGPIDYSDLDRELTDIDDAIGAALTKVLDLSRMIRYLGEPDPQMDLYRMFRLSPGLSGGELD
jgi:hypothetical protein